MSYHPGWIKRRSKNLFLNGSLGKSERSNWSDRGIGRTIIQSWPSSKTQSCKSTHYSMYGMYKIQRLGMFIEHCSMTLQTATEGPLNPVVKDTEPNPHCLKLDPLSKKPNELMHVYRLQMSLRHICACMYTLRHICACMYTDYRCLFDIFVLCKQATSLLCFCWTFSTICWSLWWPLRWPSKTLWSDQNFNTNLSTCVLKRNTPTPTFSKIIPT